MHPSAPPTSHPISYIAKSLHREDPDAYDAMMMCPPSIRIHAGALYHVCHELAGIHHKVTEPTLALLRLQWWEEGLRRACAPIPPATIPQAGSSNTSPWGTFTDTPTGHMADQALQYIVHHSTDDGARLMGDTLTRLFTAHRQAYEQADNPVSSSTPVAVRMRLTHALLYKAETLSHTYAHMIRHSADAYALIRTLYANASTHAIDHATIEHTLKTATVHIAEARVLQAQEPCPGFPVLLPLLQTERNIRTIRRALKHKATNPLRPPNLRAPYYIMAALQAGFSKKC